MTEIGRIIKVYSFFTLYAAALYAADQDTAKARADSVVELDKIVVTATRTARLVAETPASVDIITKKTISASPAKTIEDLLITQTGVQARRTAAIGEGIPSDIIIRGIPGALAASRTLILVDGIPTNASGTPFLIVNEVPLEAIERIEIVRGPYSSLYGANAFGGVVNILTREGLGKIHGGVTFETAYPFTLLDQYYSADLPMSDAVRKAGTLTYWNVNGTGNGGTDRIGFLLSTGYRTIGNYLLRNYAIAKNGEKINNKKPDNHDYADFRVFGKSRFRITENSDVFLHVRYFNSSLGFGKTKNIIPDSLDIETRGEKILVGPQVRISVSKNVVLRAGAFYRNVTGEFWNEGTDSAKKPVQSYWKSQTSDWQIESQGIITLGTHNVVTTGLEFLRNHVDFGATVDPATGKILPNSFSIAQRIINGAGFIQDEIKLFDRLNIVPVIRLDYHSEFGSAFSPKLGISYKIIEQLRFRTSAGRSFRAPSLAELYMPDLTIKPDFVLRSNPGIKPEYIWGADAGFDIAPVKSLTLKTGAYYNAMKDLISQTVVSDTTGMYISHRNISRAWSAGFEGEIEWNPLQWLNVSTRGTIQKSRDSTYKTPLDYVPRYTLGFGLRASHKIGTVKLEGQAGFNYVGAREYQDFTKAEVLITNSGTKLKPMSIHLGAYNTTDLSVRVFLPRYVWLLLAAQNIFDEVYEESSGTLGPGRFASLKIGADF